MVFLAIFLTERHSATENREVSSAPFVSLKPLIIQGDSIAEAKTFEKAKDGTGRKQNKEKKL